LRLSGGEAIIGREPIQKAGLTYISCGTPNPEY
jgi:hypothetical protein